MIQNIIKDQMLDLLDKYNKMFVVEKNECTKNQIKTGMIAVAECIDIVRHSYPCNNKECLKNRPLETKEETNCTGFKFKDLKKCQKYIPKLF